MNALRRFLLALQFFTRIPVTGALARWVGYSPALLRESAGHFPGVGWVVGLVGALVFGAALWRLPGEVGALAAALLSISATVYLTGAFHEDGLADLSDGLGGSHERERALAIMKDSRIGSFGAMALVLALGLKAALLAVLAGQGRASACCVLLGAQVLSRYAPLWVMYWLPYVGDADASKSKPLADAVSPAALLTGAVWSFPALALLAWSHGSMALAVACLAAIATTAYLIWRFTRRLQGFTGDGLGATQQLSELAIYLALAV